jgi:integrase
MPRRRKSVPNYSHHKPSDQAYVRVPDASGGRKTLYLGPYGSPESRQQYARVVAQLGSTSGPAACPQSQEGVQAVTVNEVFLAFWRHADRHYRRADGTPTNELPQYGQTFRLVKDLFGRTPAIDFGPKALKVLRQRMIDTGWTRKLINQRVGRVRRVFKWAASEQMIPVGVYQALATVTGLQAGRTTARETEAVQPIAEEHVRATLPFLRPAVGAMVQVQLLTGMRPREVCQLRPCDVDASAPVWLFHPAQYKTRHRNKPRVVGIGRMGQALLGAFTPADPADFDFSPRQVVAELHAERAANRKTPRYRAHVARNTAKRVERPARLPAAKYTVTAFGQAINRAVDRANAHRGRLAGPGNFDPVRRWHPNQLRHAHGTNARRRFGLEAAQVALGHERADVTQVYAEKNLARAVQVAAEVG